MLLVEGARRIDAWARLADRLPHARVVPAFVAAEPTLLPLLHLVPQQWEVLTQVDGRRDLPALAEAMGRDLLDVAEIVHGLIETGLLAIVDTARPARAHATPPSASAAVVNGDADAASSDSLLVENADDAKREYSWATQHAAAPTAHATSKDVEHDAAFEPVRGGGIATEAALRLRTPSTAHDVVRFTRSALQLREEGDRAARAGRFDDALAHWTASLAHTSDGMHAERTREALAIVRRLLVLINVTAHA